MCARLRQSTQGRDHLCAKARRIFKVCMQLLAKSVPRPRARRLGRMDFMARRREPGANSASFALRGSIAAQLGLCLVEAGAGEVFVQ